MTCLHCGNPATIRAHLVPEAFVMEVKADRGEQHLILHGKDARPQVSNTGIYDRDLLCGHCDGILGAYQGYAFETFKRLRMVGRVPGSLAETGPIDGDTIVRFAAGVAWKYTATKSRFGRIDVGPYASILENVALGGAAIPPMLDVAIIRLVEFDGDVYFYRAPLPARHGGINAGGSRSEASSSISR